MNWLYVLIGQVAVRILLLGIFVFVVLTVAGWYSRQPIRHYPQQHICGVCRARWYEGHVCAPPMIGSAPQVIWRPTKEIDRRYP